MEPAAQTCFTEDEYLALEQASHSKHAFIAGQILAMAGGSPEHNLIAANVTRSLGNRLAGRPCLVFGSDQRIYIHASGTYTYPDITVVCGRPEYARRDPQAITNPLVLIEVLSPATERYDLGAKLDLYRGLPAMMEFAAIRQDRRDAYHYRRTDVGRWILTEIAGDAAIELPSLDVSLPLGEVYDKLDLLAGIVP